MRPWAVLAAVLPPIVYVAAGASLPAAAFSLQWPLVLTLAPAALLSAWARRRWGTALLGVALVVACTDGAPRTWTAIGLHGWLPFAPSWARYDLRETPLPDVPPPFVELTGYFRAGWSLAEYDVPPGEHPDQSRAPLATLVAFLGTDDEVVRQRGPVVIARVDPDALDRPAPQTIRGRRRPLPAQLLTTLVQSPADRPHAGILVDTLDLPSRRSAWTSLALTLLTGLLGIASYLGVAASPGPPAHDREVSTGRPRRIP